MKKIILTFLYKLTEEYDEPRIHKQIIILYKKYKHHNYHNDFFKYGKLVIILLVIFISLFIFLKFITDQKVISANTQTNIPE